MKVFISWSGELSKNIGERFRRWLPGALQMVEPYFTPADIEKGTRWQAEIAKELEASKVGMFCVTRESLNSGWLLFEAGALSKSLDKTHVCPILFGVDEAEVPTPLSQFQTTRFERGEIWHLFKTINSSAEGARLPDDVLQDVFTKWWPDLERDVHAILAENADRDTEPLRSERELLEEVLTLTRHLSARVGPSPRIPFALVRSLGEKYLAAYAAAKVGAGTEGIFEALEGMQKPVDYLLRSGLNDGPPALRAVHDEVVALDFEYPTITPGPPMDDDDIPF